MTYPLICGFLISFPREIPKTTSYVILAIVILVRVMFFYKRAIQDDETSGLVTSFFFKIKLQRLSFVVLFARATILFSHCERCVCGENRFVIMTRNDALFQVYLG